LGPHPDLPYARPAHAAAHRAQDFGELLDFWPVPPLALILGRAAPIRHRFAGGSQKVAHESAAL